jgi:hypothetical protein
MDNIIVVDFSRTHWKRCVDPNCEDCMVETVVDTYCAFHPHVSREDARTLIMQGLAFQRSLDETLAEDG